MPWVAVDKDRTEAIYSKKPLRSERIWLDRPHPSTRVNDTMNLPPGSIERLIGRRLTWEHEPVELTEETLATESKIAELLQLQNQVVSELTFQRNKLRAEVERLKSLAKQVEVTDEEIEKNMPSPDVTRDLAKKNWTRERMKK